MTQRRSAIQELRHKVGDLGDDLDALEALLDVDVPSSLNKIRFITEKVLHRLCKAKDVSWGQAEPTLERMIGPLTAADCIPKNIAIHVRTIQTNTSPGSHYQDVPLSASHVAIAQSALVEFLHWYYRQSNGNPVDSDLDTGWSLGGWIKQAYRDAAATVPSCIFSRNAKLRIACPVFLKMEIHNRFLLIRVPKESPDHCFLPIGGIVKHRNPRELQHLEFEPDCAPSTSKSNDLDRDLRGCIPKKHLRSFLGWFRTGQNRESDKDALRREIVEELSAVGFQGYDSQILQMRLQLVRDVHQAPTPTPGCRYQFQYRRTAVFEGSFGCKFTEEFRRILAEEVTKNPHLMLASAPEILRGRAANGEPIAHNATYLFTDARRPGEPGEL